MLKIYIYISIVNGYMTMVIIDEGTAKISIRTTTSTDAAIRYEVFQFISNRVVAELILLL